MHAAARASADDEKGREALLGHGEMQPSMSVTMTSRNLAAAIAVAYVSFLGPRSQLIHAAGPAAESTTPLR